jgi:hypothetical protein
VRFAATIAGVTTVMAVAELRSPAQSDDVEVGGYAGAIVSNILTTYDCPDDQSDGCSSFSLPGHIGRGLSLGAYVRYAATSHVWLEANLMYAMKGYDSGSVVRFHYLEAPLLVRYSWDDEATRTRAFVHAGVAGRARGVSRIGCRGR